MAEKYNPRETKRNIKSKEDTPPMFGKTFNKEKSASIHAAVLEHVGDELPEPTESEPEKLEIEKEILSDDEEFLPVGSVDSAKAEEDVPVFDMRISVPPDAPEDKKEKVVASTVPQPEIAPIPDEETIATAVLKEVKKRSESETKGFKAAGDRIRIILPDIPNDPEKVGRVTELGLKMIEMSEKRRLAEKKRKK